MQDMKSGQGGLLQVCMEGIGLLFANSKVLMKSRAQCMIHIDGSFLSRQKKNATSAFRCVHQFG